MPKTMKDNDKLNIYANTGTKAAATIKPNDTYLLIITITNQIKNTHTDTVGINIINTPRPVATPLPPLKRRRYRSGMTYNR